MVDIHIKAVIQRICKREKNTKRKEQQTESAENSKKMQNSVQKFVELLKSDFKTLSLETKKKYPQIKEVIIMIQIFTFSCLSVCYWIARQVLRGGEIPWFLGVLKTPKDDYILTHLWERYGLVSTFWGISFCFLFCDQVANTNDEVKSKWLQPLMIVWCWAGVV